MSMRKSGLVGVLVAVVALGAPAASFAGELREHFERSVAIAADGRVSLDNVNGDVTVEVWDQNEVWVRAEKLAPTGELLERLKIEVEASERGVHIVTRYPQSWGGARHESRRLEVNYILTVPRTAHIDGIDLVNGDLTIRGLAAAVRADSVNGDIMVDGFRDSLDLQSVNGLIDVYCGAVEPEAKLELESVNGLVRVHLPSSAAVSVDVTTVNGSIANDFGLDVTTHKYVGADLRGELGGGGARLRVTTVNGSVKILKD